MDDYIKREDALKWIAIDGDKGCADYSDCEYRDTDKACSDCLYSDVNKIPAADVREVVRGEWIPFERDTGHQFKERGVRCKQCGAGELPFARNFCPDCGADMR